MRIVRAAAAWLALSALAPPPQAAPGAAAAPGYRLHAAGGRTVTDRSYRGLVQIVSFGFTYCPDVCPTTLTSIAAGVNALGGDGKQVRVLFISVDPARDTPAVLAQYAAAFGSRVVGLSGTRAEIDAAARYFGARYSLRPDGRGGYDVSHTGLVWLLDRNGRLAKQLPPGTPPRRYAEEIRRILAIPAGSGS